jgi:hypothetical protein
MSCVVAHLLRVLCAFFQFEPLLFRFSPLFFRFPVRDAHIPIDFQRMLALLTLAAATLVQVVWYPPGIGALQPLSISLLDSVSFVWTNGTHDVSTPAQDMHHATGKTISTRAIQ